jgi:hypothetical protein
MTRANAVRKIGRKSEELRERIAALEQSGVSRYGDSEAHLNIARRILDSQTPGCDQLGTYWLPLPHVLMLPFVRVDAWWHSGIAASFSGALCFVIGGESRQINANRLLSRRPLRLECDFFDGDGTRQTWTR